MEEQGFITGKSLLRLLRKLRVLERKSSLKSLARKSKNGY